MSQELEILERKFRSFLNKTIIGASNDYFSKQKKINFRELQVIDIDESELYLRDYAQEEAIEQLSDFGRNSKLDMGLKLLSVVERTVIFLCFEKKYKTNEIAKIMNLREQSISRIKKRALDKLKCFMEGFDENE